jgi:hypothetical protein
MNPAAGAIALCRMRRRSELVTFSGSGRSGAAWFRERDR